jgi:acetyl esterase
LVRAECFSPAEHRVPPGISGRENPNVTTAQHDVQAARLAVRKIMHRAPRYEPACTVDIRDVRPEALNHSASIRLYSPRRGPGTLPGLLYIHGGAYISGSIELFDSECVRLADRVNVVVASVDYRLAPEYRFPAGLEDCYAALCWFAAAAPSQGVDPDRIAVAGESAGAGLAAAVTLLARDRHGPSMCLQSLSIPQLDDRLDTQSMADFASGPNWDRADAEASWDHYLGAGNRGSDEVSMYAAPARAADLSGLTPAFVAVRQSDPCRDEGFAYARRLIQAGVSTELRHYPNVHHGSHLVPSPIRDRMYEEREAAMRRRLWPAARREAA